jgi:2-methylcitrate dehydratase PrpD
MSATAAETLAKHFANLKAGDIPKVKIAECKALVRDYLGVALAGSQTGSGKAARAFALDVGGKAENTLIGYGDKVPAVHGALVNAISSHSIELDDVDILALFHFSPPVVSAALAAAERENASGAEFIAAVVAGCDMMARASDAMNFSLRNRGYHTTPVCGVFGATIAAARLFKLNEEQTVSALGMAGAQASGLMEMYGPSMQKRFNPGPAARNGVTAAQMARHGFTGAATIFDGERGVLKAFTDENDLAALTRNLGTDYPVHIEYKAYSCARPIHNAIDCALAVRKELKEPLSAIKSMTMRRHPAWANYHLNTRPKTYHEAQVSLPYSVAVALIEGAAFFPQYQNEKLGDKDILRLSDLLKIVPDDSLPRGVSCHLVVETAGGAKLESQIDHPKGSIAYPMTDEEMRAKVHLLGDSVLGADQVNRMIAAIDKVETLDSISTLTKLTVPGG